MPGLFSRQRCFDAGDAMPYKPCEPRVGNEAKDVIPAIVIFLSAIVAGLSADIVPDHEAWSG